MTEKEVLPFIVPVHVWYRNYSGEKHLGIIHVNTHIADQTINLFEDLYKISFPIAYVGPSFNYPDYVLIDNNTTTGYNFRTVEGTEKLSMHAYGLAIDINPKDNPAKPTKFSQFYNYDSKIGKITPEVVAIANKHGFMWGGEIFKNFYDPHHFEV